MKKKTLTNQPLNDVEREKAIAIHEYITTNYNKRISRKQLCKRFGVNKNFFSDRWPLQYEKKFLQVRTEKRMTVALVLLQANTLEKEIASDLGYSSLQVFSKAFKKYYKCSPTEWLERKRTNG